MTWGIVEEQDGIAILMFLAPVQLSKNLIEDTCDLPQPNFSANFLTPEVGFFL